MVRYRYVVALGMALLTTAAKAQLKGPVISGAPEPQAETYKPMVIGMARQILKDPDSAMYDWSQPYQLTCRKGVYKTPDRWKGWAVDVNINAKNSFGGYTGGKLYTVIFTSDGSEDYTEILDGTVFWMFHSCRKEAWQ